MTTNFYFVSTAEGANAAAADYHSHGHPVSDFIGKRSAAGPYCWRCKRTLHRGGEESVHKGRGADLFYTACPSCGDEMPKLGVREPGNGIGVELGFAPPRQSRLSIGVRPVSSFTFHLPKALVEDRVARGESVIDEYGRTQSGPQFLEMVDFNCPILFFSPEDNWS
jgi:hypothetical protein